MVFYWPTVSLLFSLQALRFGLIGRIIFVVDFLFVACLPGIFSSNTNGFLSLNTSNPPGRGSSNGWHLNRQYFTVAPNCAIFVGAHRVVALHPSSPRRHCNNNQGQQQQHQQTPLAINERIVWMADSGPEFGTVRWIGILEDVSEDWTVGVEFDK